MKSLMTVLLGLVVLVGVFLAGAYSEYTTGFPFTQMMAQAPVAPPRAPPPPVNGPVSSVPSNVIPRSSNSSTNVPIVSTAQGAQDAARADTPHGRNRRSSALLRDHDRPQAGPVRSQDRLRQTDRWHHPLSLVALPDLARFLRQSGHPALQS